ncbi:MAG: exodeoxyribonuclease VII small subunit [Lachnospiraceae bacterium]|nr:exodeoxyribonuclease VII small subunit [Lachnospiraceae bacterium]
MAKETYSLEENFARLEQEIEKLEAEDVTLEEAFQAYSAGMKLLKDCNAQIDKVEKKVLKLTAEGQLEEL